MRVETARWERNEIERHARRRAWWDSGTADASLDVAIAAFTASAPAADTASTSRRTTAEVIAAAGPADWPPDPANAIYLQIAAVAWSSSWPRFCAPPACGKHKNVGREGYFDGLAIIRSRDNFVVQWGDADGKRPLKSAGRGSHRSSRLRRGCRCSPGYQTRTAMHRKQVSPADSRRRAIRAPAESVGWCIATRW